MTKHPRRAKSAAKPIIDVDLSDDSDYLPAPTRTKTQTKKSAKGKGNDIFKVVEVKEKIREDPTSSEDEQEQEEEQEGGSRKRRASMPLPPAKKSKTNARKSGQASPEIPEVPPMSEDEHEDEREEDFRLFKKPTKPLRGIQDFKVALLQNIIQIQSPKFSTTININLGDLLSARVRSQDMPEWLNDSTFVEGGRRAKKSELFVDMRADPEYACFLELAPELRNRIYRDVMVVDTPVTFNPSRELPRSAAVLRTCRQVYKEAREILYGENAFHLDRTERPRGGLFTPWREVGYKDMRRFLEMIGQENLSKMRFLSIYLSDGAPIWTPDLTPEQRKYVNDPVLLQILKIIGDSNAVFEKLVVDFGGRAGVDFDDVAFLRAFTTIRCKKLDKTCYWHHSRIRDNLFKQMKEFMEVPVPPNVDFDKQIAPTMQNKLSGRQYSCYAFKCGSD